MSRRLDRITLLAAPVVVLATLSRSLPTSSTALTLDSLTERVLVQAHIVGGTLWVGGLALLVLLSRSRTVRNATGGADTWALIWLRFSTLALCAVGAVLISGLALIWKEFGTLGQLFTTSFGRFLVVKLILVTAMITAGAINQLWLLPRIARHRAAGDTDTVWQLTLRRFPRLVTIEAILGVGVLAIVPFLTGSPRDQAGDTGAEHVVTPGLLLIGALLALMLVLSLAAMSKASDALSRRAQADGAIELSSA